MNKIIIFLFITSFPSTIFGGWLGPENYEECLLEKMKGQVEAMLLTAEMACEMKFPFERELNNDYGENLKVSWTSDNSALYLIIKENLGIFEITRYRASFSLKSCDQITSQTDYVLSTNFKFSASDKHSLELVSNASQYKCMKTEKNWGKMRRGEYNQ